MIVFAPTSVVGGGPATATATVVTYYGGSSPGSSVTVWDVNGVCGRSLSGAIGYAVWNDTTGHWEILICDQQALVVSGTTSGAIANASASVGVLGATAMTPWPFSQSPTGSVYANNTCGLAAAAGANCIAVANGNGWILQQVEHQVVTFLTGVQWDSGSLSLQSSSRDIACMPNADDTGMVTFTTATTCD